MRPLAAAGSVLPIVGALLEKGLAFVAFVLATSCALLTIALAWVFHRPLLGIALLLAVAGHRGVRLRRAEEAGYAEPLELLRLERCSRGRGAQGKDKRRLG